MEICLVLGLPQVNLNVVCSYSKTESLAGRKVQKNKKRKKKHILGLCNTKKPILD